MKFKSARPKSAKKIISKLGVKSIVPRKKRAMATRVDPEQRRFSGLGRVNGFFFSVVRFLRRNLIISSILLVAVSLLILVFFTPVLKIQSYDFSFSNGEECISRDVFLDQIAIENGYPWSYLGYDLTELKKKNSCLEDLAFGWNLFKPFTIHVTVYSRKPVLKLTASRIEAPNGTPSAELLFTAAAVEEKEFFVSSEGEVFALSNDFGVPRLSYKTTESDLQKSIHFSNKSVEFLLQLNKYFEETYSTLPDAVVLDSGSVRVQLPTNQYVYLTLHRPLDEQLGSLQSILSQSTIDKTRVKIIDVRYINPYIRYD